MKTGNVIVSDSDPSWPRRFEEIRAEVTAALGASALRIEHVGSTSVPGLAAKPIIDLDVVIADEEDLPGVIAKLAAAGYLHEGDLGIPGREAFRYEGKTHLMKHHLYVCREYSGELKRHIAFRDYLRSHPEDAKTYGAVKLEAAQLHPDSIAKYMEHKSSCIEMLYQKCGLK